MAPNSPSIRAQIFVSKGSSAIPRYCRQAKERSHTAEDQRDDSSGGEAWGQRCNRAILAFEVEVILSVRSRITKIWNAACIANLRLSAAERCSAIVGILLTS